MSNKDYRGILITGTHRSGSTWIGKMISLAKKVGYIHEPFNPKSSIAEGHFDFWYTYIDSSSEARYKKVFDNLIGLKYPYSEFGLDSVNVKNIGRYLRDFLSITKLRAFNQIPLIKDPIALLSAEWLYKNYHLKVVVIVRHPAAFVASLKHADWHFPFEHLTQQESFLELLPPKIVDDLRYYSQFRQSIIDQGILLWNTMHYMILRYQEKYQNEWLFVTHEEISREAHLGFAKIFNYLDIEYDELLAKEISDYSDNRGSDNKVSRNSIKNIKSWKDRLSESEISIIRKRTDEISSKFYEDKDW